LRLSGFNPCKSLAGLLVICFILLASACSTVPMTFSNGALISPQVISVISLRFITSRQSSLLHIGDKDFEMSLVSAIESLGAKFYFSPY